MIGNPLKQRDPRTPCEKAICANIGRCASEQLACRSFEIWVNSERALYPTEPTREIYVRIFNDEEEPPMGRVRGGTNVKKHEDMIE